MKKLVAVMCVVLLAAGTAFAASPAPELVVQLMENEPADYAMVAAQINTLLLQKLNCTVKFQHLTWTDWQQRYKLLVTSGERVDVLYAANWNNYAQYARDGAYLQLDTLAPKTIPNLYKAIRKSDWDGVKIGGHIYAVPDLKDGFSGSFHMIYREDLRKKYGTPPITDIASIEKFFDAIKKNEPSMYPVEERGDGFLITQFTYLLAKAYPKSAWSTGMLGSQSNLLFFDYRNPKVDFKAPYDFPEYKQFLQTMHNYAQKGYWGKDLLSETSIAPELLEAGKTAASIGGGENVDKVQELIQRVTKNNPTWEIGEYSWDKARGFAIPSAAQQDLSTIPIQSKYPELGLKVIEACLMDKDLQFLIDYGIKGVHYTINEKNQYVQLPGAKNYAIFGMAAWAWKNQNLLLADGSVWGPQHDAYYKTFTSLVVPNNGFAFNMDAVKAEMTACLQVEQQYGWPLWSGLVANIDDGERTFEQQLQAAGFDKVRAEIRKQWLAYQAEMGQ
jgi:putative aldouronate transport system substrate-binding protein